MPEPESSSPRLSLRDIAKELGVSHSTVSLALRDHPRISKEVKEKVRRKAEALGYQPDPMLAALAHYRREKSSKPISACLGWINAWQRPEDLRSLKEFDLYWKGAHAAAAKFGYRLEEFRLGGEFTPKRLHQILQARGIRGLLLPPHSENPDWGDFPWEHYSIVRFGRSLHEPRTHLVTSDQVANTILAFQRIRELGYPRIGFVTNEIAMSERGHLFEAGFLVAQRLIDENLRLPVFVTSQFKMTDCPKAFSAWVKKHKPDAILTDMPEVPDLLKHAGVRVPEDIGLAVTSILDARADAGIDQHSEEIGRVGFLMLNSVINDGVRGIPSIFRQILVEGGWVDGSSLPRRR